MVERHEVPQSRLARSVIRYLSESPNYPYGKLTKVWRVGSYDVIDIEVEIELEQRRHVPIRPKEPIRLVFISNDDSQQPIVLSRRADFPIGMVHTNFDRVADGGVVLCIWEEGWFDLAANLTGQSLIERIRTWLSSMAAGTIHDEEQFLEPLIHPGSNTLIIPTGDLNGPWYIQRATKHEDHVTISMSREKPATNVQGNSFAIYSSHLPAQLHRGLARTPYDLGALQRLCLDLGFDLIQNLAQWLLHNEQLERTASRQLILILMVPKRRTVEGLDEQLEVWCYTLGNNLAQLGELLDVTITEPQAGLTTAKLFGNPNNADLSSIIMDPWRVVKRLDRAAARCFAGTSHLKDTALLAIGAGAIGSHVIMTATRAGIGPWVVIDGDITLPHNTVRQAYGNASIGFPKALVLQNNLENILEEGGNTAIPINVFMPGTHQAALDAAVSDTEIAVDFSASPAVLGWLSDQPVKRGVSTFFGPDGSDLVVLAEDKDRNILLDEIEAQYFWAVATSRQLKGHLAAARIDQIRYANACQDLSRPLPPWQLQTLCGLAAGQLKKIIDHTHASFQMWRLEPETGAVHAVTIPVQSVCRFKSSSMRASVTTSTVQAMRDLRLQADRNETGGVLIGTYDLIRNVVHIVAALPAPADSKQAPTYFIRGIKDLKPRVEVLANASAGRLHYIGEWHSHPGKVLARPSDDDEKVYAHLETHLGPVGSPYLMVICGERDTWIRTGWNERGSLEGVITHECG